MSLPVWPKPVKQLRHGFGAWGCGQNHLRSSQSLAMTRLRLSFCCRCKRSLPVFRSIKRVPAPGLWPRPCTQTCWRIECRGAPSRRSPAPQPGRLASHHCAATRCRSLFRRRAAAPHRCRSDFQVWPSVPHRSHHVLLVSAVIADACDFHVLAIAKIPSTALETSAVVAAVPTDTSALALRPTRNTIAEFLDDASNFMPWNARKLDAGPQAFLREHITVAHTASQHLDEHVPRTRLRNLARDNREIASRFGNLRAFMGAIATFEVAIMPPAKSQQ